MISFPNIYLDILKRKLTKENPFADGAKVNQYFAAQLLELLGPETEEDKLKALEAKSKNKKNKKKKKKQQQKNKKK